MAELYNDCGHDEFDSDCGLCWTRANWRGCEWLGIESIHGPRRDEEGIDLDLDRNLLNGIRF